MAEYSNHNRQQHHHRSSNSIQQENHHHHLKRHVQYGRIVLVLMVLATITLGPYLASYISHQTSNAVYQNADQQIVVAVREKRETSSSLSTLKQHNNKEDVNGYNSPSLVQDAAAASLQKTNHNFLKLRSDRDGSSVENKIIPSNIIGTSSRSRSVKSYPQQNLNNQRNRPDGQAVANGQSQLKYFNNKNQYHEEQQLQKINDPHSHEEANHSRFKRGSDLTDINKAKTVSGIAARTSNEIREKRVAAPPTPPPPAAKKNKKKNKNSKTINSQNKVTLDEAKKPKITGNNLTLDYELRMSSKEMSARSVRPYKYPARGTQQITIREDPGPYSYLRFRPYIPVCQCNVYGSHHEVCNPYSGICACRPNVIGNNCDKCKPGYWNLTSRRGCAECSCNDDGSQKRSCDTFTGKCNCKPGVDGKTCDRCSEDHYGFSSKGCKKCDECPNSVFVCDTNNGRCICPPKSRGPECQNCIANTWGWEYRKGCKDCECNSVGAIGQTCDLTSGQCFCRAGFTGPKCDKCASGYYGYPECQRCNCDGRGTTPNERGEISCNENGECACKSNVRGIKCNQCLETTFGLSSDNPSGCSPCFCFGRSEMCSASNLTWGQIRHPYERALNINYLSNMRYTKQYYESIVVHHNDGSSEASEIIQSANGLLLIPTTSGNVTIGSYAPLHAPFYFQMPKQFLGDKIKSYGGYFNFSLNVQGCETSFNTDVLKRYPLIQIHSHDTYILEHHGPILQNSTASYFVQMHESNWRYYENQQQITRPIMMTALQNVKHIFIRAGVYSDFTQVVLSNVSLDQAIYVLGANNHHAVQIEQCKCRDIYNGSSCQDPGDGYYRLKSSPVGDINHYESFIGVIVPCKCNGRASTCDKETGKCMNCTNNTGGDLCSECAEGFYGSPNYGDGCVPCPCPETRKNFAKGCYMIGNNVSCLCKPGYMGHKCEICSDGYFGNPEFEYGKCELCNCNADGSLGNDCDKKTGQCHCRSGVLGRQCDRCDQPKHILQNSRCELCDVCSLELLNKLDDISEEAKASFSYIDSIEIIAPWETLDNFTREMKTLKQAHHDIGKMHDTIYGWDDIALDKLQSNSKHLNDKFTKMKNNKLEKCRLENNKLHEDSVEMLEDTIEIKNGINGTTVQLNDYSMHLAHVSVRNALAEAKTFAQKIAEYDSLLANHKTALAKSLICSNIIKSQADEYAEMQFSQTHKLDAELGNLEMLHNKLHDLEKHLKTITTQSTQTKEQNELNAENINKLTREIQKIQQLKNDINPHLNHSLYAQATVLQDQINGNIPGLQKLIVDFKMLNSTLREKLLDDQVALQALKSGILNEADDKLEHLLERSIKYSEKFQKTRIGAKEAIEASNAHKRIIEAIKEADEAANQTIVSSNASFLELNPPNGESVIKTAEHSREESRQIISEAEGKKQDIAVLTEDLLGHKKKVDSIKDVIWETGQANNNFTTTLGGLYKSNNTAKIGRVKEMASMISEEMRNLRGDAIEIGSKTNALKEKLANMGPTMESQFSRAKENVSDILSAARKSKELLQKLETSWNIDTERFAKVNSTLPQKIQKLRDEIAKARHIAEGIRISLNAPKDEPCLRSFIPKNFGRKAVTVIEMQIASTTDDQNSPILVLHAEDDKFIALEMVERKIRLVWNLGGKTTTVTHPEEIEMRNITNNEAWYHIEAHGTLNIGTLNVRQMNVSGMYKHSTGVTAKSDEEFTILHLSRKSRIWVGGVPNNESMRSNLMVTSGLGFAIHQVKIDRQPIGLWNYETSYGDCKGAITAPQETESTENARYFNGKGYSKTAQISSKPYKKTIFFVDLSFKTLDENALIFLAVDEVNNRSISLTLFEGRIVFRIDYGAETKLEINTTQKYNTGKWINLSAARQFGKSKTENGRMEVNGQVFEGSPRTPVGLEMLPDLSKELFYLGGVPPGFKSGSTKAPGADNAFLGCMKNVQINQEVVDPMGTSLHFGVESQCREIITKAGFYGDGYIELPSHSLRRRGNFTFTFRSLQNNALLLMSTCPPNLPSSTFDERESSGDYSVSLVKGFLQLRIDPGKGHLEASTNTTFNDGEYHVVQVIKVQRRIQFRVDDELHATMQIPKEPFAINMPEEDGGLYLGGAPHFEEYEFLVPTLERLNGTIRDVVFNKKMISFTNFLNFTNVQMGRSGPQMGSYNGHDAIGKGFKQIGEGCQRVGSYSYEPNAFKFGDGNRSYSLISISKAKFWQNNFLIEFDFRTFYPNGILFIVPGLNEKNRHFLSLIIKDGHLHLSFRDKRKVQLKQPQKFNDGQWHHVTIKSQNKVTHLTVGNSRNKHNTVQIKIPKRAQLANILSFGGIPDNRSTLPKQISKLEQFEFKGCIRKLSINNATQDLARPGLHHNIGQCFPRVERGSFFSGDAYAIYSRHFDISHQLEFKLEFKTSELNGILFSVSDPSGTPALALEMYNGNIYMACDLGIGFPYNIQTRLPSKFSLCDNKWHTVSGIYDLHNIAIKIDNEPSISRNSQNHGSGNVKTAAPLYIGGIPDIAPSSILQSRENFKGCIKNIVIGSEIKDWTDMDELHSVLLSECLAIT